MKTRFFVSGLISSMVLAQIALAGGISTAGIPNPSSAHCIELGGTLEMYQNELGQTGFCRIDSALIEEWTLFRATVDQSETEATSVFLGDDARSPMIGEAGFCSQVFGQFEVLSGPLGSSAQLGVCRFRDGSVIEARTLFQGAQKAGYTRLGELLGKR